MKNNIAEIKKKSVSGVVSYSVRTVLLYIIAIVATGFLSAFLKPEEFGVYFVVTSVIGIFTFLSDIGLAAALVQKKEAPTKEELRTTFTIQQLLAVLIFVITILLTPIWKQYTGLDQAGLHLLYALSFSFVLASLKTIPSILLERELLFNKLVIPQIFEQIIFYGLVVWLAYRGYGVTSYTYAVLARSLAGVIVMYTIQSWSIGFQISKQALKKLIGFGFTFQLNDLLARLKDDLFIVVLAKFLPAAQMGYIGWAKRWSMFPYQFSVNNVIAITFPTYSRLQDQKEFLKRAIEKSLFFITLLIFPILAGMSALAHPITILIPSYAKWQPALPALYFFCINIAWAAVTSPLTNTLNALGHINKTLRLMIMWTVLTWALTPLGIYYWQGTGVAVITALVSTTSIVAIRMVKKIINVEVFNPIKIQLLASLVMLAALLYMQSVTVITWTNMIIHIGIGAAIYTGIIAMLGYKTVVKEIKSLKKSSS